MNSPYLSRKAKEKQKKREERKRKEKKKKKRKEKKKRKRRWNKEKRKERKAFICAPVFEKSILVWPFENLCLNTPLCHKYQFQNFSMWAEK